MALCFIGPFDGDCLTNKAGRLAPDGRSLTVAVRVSAPAGHDVTVAGVPAVPAGDGTFCADVRLTGYENRLTALDRTSGERAEATVFWLPRATNCYRLSVDDNIWFLQNIAKHQSEYKSLFDDPYLALFYDVHERYGTKVHFNIYYECPEFGGFCLTDMPNRYRAEWRANADWLHLSFHARANLPDRPYLTADYGTVRRDAETVMREILRFAGEEVLPAETTLHWGAATREGVRALHDVGVRTLAGYLRLDQRGDPLVSYYLSPEEVLRTDRYGIFYDRREDVTFSKIDTVLNSGDCRGNVERLEQKYAEHPEKGFWEFLIHEEYFYPFYQNYLPDFRERVLAAVAWAEQKKLTPTFLGQTHGAWTF